MSEAEGGWSMNDYCCLGHFRRIRKCVSTSPATRNTLAECSDDEISVCHIQYHHMRDSVQRKKREIEHGSFEQDHAGTFTMRFGVGGVSAGEISC